MVVSCLITSSPTFDDPVRTAPFFVPDSFVPDPRKVLVLKPTTPTVTFEGFYVGEDAGDAVEVKLLLDYGWPDLDDKPYRDEKAGFSPDPPGSLDGDARRIQAKLTQALTMLPGCHRLTLMVSHQFDAATGCPVDPDDYALITWTVLKCDDLGICPAVDLTVDGGGDDPSCPPVTASCASQSPTSTSSGAQ